LEKVSSKKVAMCLFYGPLETFGKSFIKKSGNAAFLHGRGKTTLFHAALCIK
jgi:hypothetical protein